MALPIDPGKIKKVAQNIVSNVDVDVTVNIYFDSATNKDMLSSFKKYFGLVNDDVQINYINLDKNNIYAESKPDFCVILAGSAPINVDTYTSFNIIGIPIIIFAVNPTDILDYAKSHNMKIKNCDLICPSYNSYAWETDDDGTRFIDFDNYTKAMDTSIKDKFEDWLIICSDGLQVAFASKFPFLRNRVCKKIINATSVENAAVGALHILPGIDIPLMSLNQARMLLEIAAIYGYDVNSDRIIEIIILTLSIVGVKYLSSYVKDKVAIPKFVCDAGFGYGVTQLIGYAAKEYFSRNLAPDGFVNKIKSLVG